MDRYAGSALPHTTQVPNRGVQPAKAQGAHHIGVAYGLRGVGLFGERVQRADEQPILVRQLLMFGAGDFIDSLNDDVGASYAA